MTDQPKEYYEKRPGFEIKSGVPDGAGRTIDYSVITDKTQGFQYSTDGTKFDLTNKTSYELCGEDCQPKEPAKIIRAKNGDIIIEAMSGEIVLRGKNIRIEAIDGKGEVTVTSTSQIALNSPIQSFKSTNSNSVSTNNHTVAGNVVEDTAGVVKSSSVATDATQGSFLGSLMKVIQKFKKWLECAP